MYSYIDVSAGIVALPLLHSVNCNRVHLITVWCYGWGVIHSSSSGSSTVCPASLCVQSPKNSICPSRIKLWHRKPLRYLPVGSCFGSAFGLGSSHTSNDGENVGFSISPLNCHSVPTRWCSSQPGHHKVYPYALPSLSETFLTLLIVLPHSGEDDHF